MAERALPLTGPWLGPTRQQLAEAITGRAYSAFDRPWGQEARSIRQRFYGRRVILAGGAGFIAQEALGALLQCEPAEVVLLDANENGLAEAVRAVRSSELLPPSTRLRTVLVDVCGPELPRMFAQIGQVDALMVFSAVKHVRSERDDVSALRMFGVNVGAAQRLAEAAGARDGTPVFAVSTDKAVAPASLMGASKNLMEQLLLGLYPSVTLTRFANVAFSTGSLLDSWQRRLASREALPVPADTWRFFVTPREAGQLCVLAAVAPPGSIVVPAPDLLPEIRLEEAAERFLSCYGLRAEFVDSIADASALLAAALGGTDRYPVLVTALDTAGEKRNESFVEAGAVVQPWHRELLTVRREVDAAGALSVLRWLGERIADSQLPVLGSQFDAVLGEAIPGFRHTSGGSLDDRA